MKKPKIHEYEVSFNLTGSFTECVDAENEDQAVEEAVDRVVNQLPESLNERFLDVDHVEILPIGLLEDWEVMDRYGDA